MDESRLINLLIIGWLGLSALILVVLIFITAPYGRHNRTGWGPVISARIGWIVMESSSLVAFNFFFMHGNRQFHVVTALFVLFWNIHYLNRSFFYPIQIRYGRRPMAFSVVIMGILFNSVNAYLNGRYLNLFSSRYDLEWLLNPRFILGFTLFIGGFLINNHSDSILRKLRNPGQDSYRIPEGGLFKYVSCANYLGEIIEWFGWACMTWSWVGLSFAVWTACNLTPRAVSHHKWYRDHFIAYPQERKAVIPFLF